MSRKFEIGQVVRFCGFYASGLFGLPDDGDIGVVTDISYGSVKDTYAVKWFLSKPGITTHYAESELRAVDEI